jgi:alkylation response protein AidB-like acyl-CoA dehydrogenase
VLGELLTGTATAAWAAVGLGDPGTVRLEPTGRAGELILHGQVAPVEGAPGARWLLEAANEGAGVSQVIVPASAPGVTVEALEGLDLVRRYGRVRLDQVAVERAATVGEPGAAASAISRLADIAAVLQCAETVGAIDEIFGRTVAYLANRYSFGRPLASYQALKHRCADWALALQRCHATAAAATRAVARTSPDASELTSVAKAFIGPVATELVQDCIQLHGGIGVTWEHDLHLYLRRVTVNRATYGTPEEHLERLADIVIGATA